MNLPRRLLVDDRRQDPLGALWRCAALATCASSCAEVTTATYGGLDGAVSSAVVQVSAAGAYSCALRSDGRVRCWGRYGATTDAGAPSPAPVEVPTLTDARQVVVMPDVVQSACALREGGGVVCWSLRSGVGPVAVEGLPAVTQIAAGSGHRCALTADGAVFCWGSNRFGELGRGEFSTSAAPAPVTGLGPVAQVTASEVQSCARTRDGHVWCWGRNLNGALGDGRTGGHGCPVAMEDCSAVPVRVAGLSAATDVSAGLNGACAVQGGRAWCWGWNTSGRLGDGTVESRSTPVQVRTPGDVVAVYAGYITACAVGVGGAVWCWGLDPTGASTMGEPASSLTPVAVDGLLGVRQVTGGWYHLCALRTNGDVFCWGANGFGQLAVDGVTRAGPARIAGL